MIQPLGVYDKWDGGLKKHISYLSKYLKNNDPERLEEFCITGDVARFTSSEMPDVEPPFQQWEHIYVKTKLHWWSTCFVRQQELGCLRDGVYDFCFSANAFAYRYFSSLIEMHMHSLFIKRFGRAGGLPLDMQAVPYLSLGIIMGFQPQSFNFTRLLIRAFHNKWFIYQEYPIFCFMLRILADYLDEPHLELTGNAAKEMLFHELFDKWRSSDPQAISKLCLAACDYHTHQCKPDSGNKWHEFNNGEWVRWPIEINLLFKLRQLLGLENPELDHPLMNSRLGQLPEEQPFEFDEVLVRVITRMKQQGFDEQAVFERIYYEKK
jgi:hypothetical protein